MNDEIEIPLFPLNVVLFPNSRLPLYIFEDRYKKMINNCIERSTVFGLNLFADKKIYMIGCSAEVNEVVNKMENGEMNIVIKGVERYRTNNYALSDFGYYVGKIKYIEDDNLNYNEAKMKKSVKIYNDLVELIYKGNVSKIDLNDLKWHNGERSVAFAMAEKSGFSLFERQSLLEMDIEDKRLDFILQYFDEVIPKIKGSNRISNIIKSNGYIQ